MSDTQTISFETMRHAMVVSQLRTNSVDDPRVVTAMARVPREAFFPPESRGLAYRDTAVPLGRGRSANLPLATARLLVHAELRVTDSVLLIGAACGYTAALLSELTLKVTAVESDPTLAAFARTALAPYENVTLIEGPLEAGSTVGAPYDVLIVDGAVEQVPAALYAGLKPGARIVTGLFDRGLTRLAEARNSEGGHGFATFADMDCVVLPGFARPREFRF